MENAIVGGVLDSAKPYGIMGLVVVLIMLMWFFDSRRIYSILDQYKQDMTEMRRMYEENVDLVKSYKNLAGDLKEIIIMNTQALTRMNDQIQNTGNVRPSDLKNLKGIRL
jgi:hypothetical protein